jgi:hypothetical protein
MSLRVVNLGLPKSGTTTLAHALRSAGLRVADYRIRKDQSDGDRLRGAFVAPMLYRGYFETGDPGAELQEFDAITEMSLVRRGKSLWPQMDYGLIAALRDHHPGIRFLASNRDALKLSQSMAGWSDLGTRRLPDASIPGLPSGFGGTDAERIRWINGHYAHLRALFANDPSFLEYDVADEDAAAKIGAHLGLHLPWWGRVNVNRKAG